MFGYSEANKIYFSIKNHTGYASLELDEEEKLKAFSSGHFDGYPDFKYLSTDTKLKQCHCAEHKTYNAFKKKIKKLPRKSSLEEIKNYLPSIEEINEANEFSVFCGTSFIPSASISLIFMCLPNLFNYRNTEILFMTSWLFLSLALLFISSYFIQKKYLAKPNKLQILLAQQALKEVLNAKSK